MPDDFYDLLDVPDDASQDDVKKAFREKVREYHPDLNDDPRAQAQFTALKKAYDTLGNPTERNAYDRMGHEDYVAKRIKGLPSQDKWATSSSSSGSTGAGASSASRTTSRTRQRTSATAQSSSTSSSRTAAGTASASATSSGTSSSTGRSYSRSGSTTGSGRTASPSSGQSSPSRTAAVRRRIANVRIGWPGIVAAELSYLVAVALYATLETRALRSLGGDVVGAGTDVDAWETLLRSSVTGKGVGLTTVESLIRALASSVRSQSLGDPVKTAAAVFFVLSMLALPVVYSVVVRRTRRSLSEWRPTRLYVLLSLGPLVGVVADVAGYARVGVYLACFVVLPLLAFTLLPLSAFVRPKVKRVLGWA